MLIIAGVIGGVLLGGTALATGDHNDKPKYEKSDKNHSGHSKNENCTLVKISDSKKGFKCGTPTPTATPEVTPEATPAVTPVVTPAATPALRTVQKPAVLPSVGADGR